MRLTNVALLRLPFGPLYSYALEVSGEEGRLPLSADQRRHVGEGPRAGSWMALTLTLPPEISRELLAQAWRAIITRHGALRTVFEHDEAGDLVQRPVSVGEGAWVRHEIGVGQGPHEAVRDILDEACSPFERPAHRLCVIETMDATTVLIGVDHSHVDIWSFLVIMRDLQSALEQLRATEHCRLEPAPDFAEHTALAQEREPAPAAIAARWREVLDASGGCFPVFPLPVGATEPVAERVVLREVLSVEQAGRLARHAREAEVTPLALIVSAMARATLELTGADFRALFPIHTRTQDRWHDAVGWFTQNSVLAPESAAPAAAAAAIRECIGLGAHRLDEVLEPYGAAIARPGMFAVSWLDLDRLPVRVDTAARQAELVSARILTNGVMLWFISDGSGLRLRCRFPDTVTARSSVGTWLDAVVAIARRVAAEGVVVL